MEKTLEFRGLQRKTLLNYLLSISNLKEEDVIKNEDSSLTLNASDWSVTITKEETFHVGPVISFPRLYLIFSGEEETLEKVISKLRTKTIRLGG